VTALVRIPWLAHHSEAGSIPASVAAHLERHVILCGYGPIGAAIARGLEREQIPYLVLELNAATVERARRDKIPIHFADATQPEVLEHAGVANAKAVLVTVPDPIGARAIVRETKVKNPKLFVAVRTKFSTQADELRALGADEVVVEELEAGLELLARGLRRFDVPRARIEEELERARQTARNTGRTIPVAPKKLGDITRVLKRVEVEIIDVSPDSHLDGETIDAGVRETAGATVLAVMRGSETIASPPTSAELQGHDRIVVFGSPAQVRIVEELAHAPATSLPATAADGPPRPEPGPTAGTSA
jgi:CPA2 family monovalent cation:H+ antiporter-2